jgi:hypothetical protein
MKTALLENIQAVSTGRRVYKPTPIESITLKHDNTDLNLYRGVSEEYRIEVRLGAATLISVEELLHSKEEVVNEAKRKMGRLIANHVYGDIRQKLYELAMELRSSDKYFSFDDKAMLLVDELLDMTEYY